MKNKLYALVGPHASGKTSVIRELTKLGVNYVPIYTTRSPEAYAANPVAAATLYRFIDKQEFFKQDFLVKLTYKGEYYGLMKSEILNALQNHGRSVIISDAQGIKQLSKLLKDSFESIYIMVDYVTLVERMLVMKETNDAIKYHIEYAESNGEFDTWKISNHVVKNIISFDTTLSQILAIMGLTVPMTKEQVIAGT